MIKTKNGYMYMMRHYDTHSVILIIGYNGESLKNEHGGYSSLHIGQAKYIENKFKKL
jgi:hypothetical protein